MIGNPKTALASSIETWSIDFGSYVKVRSTMSDKDDATRSLTLAEKVIMLI